MSDSEAIEGTVDRVVFENEETGWAVVRLLIAGRVAPLVAVGPLCGLGPGAGVRLHGRFEHDRVYGEQFRAESYVPVLPATIEGMRRYLKSGAVEGIGEVMADRLIERFGADTLDVIDEAPRRLTEVEGIGPKRKARILEAWRGAKDVREVMVFLQSHEISPAHAAKIYQRYGKDAVATVTADPYRLASDIRGIGFATADGIARSLGIAADAPTRAAAGVQHSLRKLADDGHVMAPRTALERQAAALLEVDLDVVRRAVDALEASGKIVVEPGAGEPSVYLLSLYDAETSAAAQLRAIAGEPTKPIEVDVDRAIEWLGSQQDVRLADKQALALRLAVRSKILVITGGPGTGKTTVIKAILDVLERKGRKIALCAPTGRAAKRMQEATSRPAKTIHRLLEFSPKLDRFQRDQEQPIDADVIVVDESSMIDVVLLSHLLEAVPRSAQLFLVGDIDQLPSVGPGNVLSEVIDSGIADVVRLDRIFRQGDASQIVVNAHEINRGALPVSSAADAGGGPTGDFFIIEKAEPEDALATVQKLIVERIPQRFGLDPIDDVQVLTPMHRGTLGATNLNVCLQEALNPEGPALVRGSRIIRVGDKVMQTKNDYDKDVFNGDLGRVVAVDLEERRVSVCFDDRTVPYETAELDALVLAYACSIHKSQGSEYPAVIIPLHTQHFVMLRRNLLYTAITRGRRLVVLVASRRALQLSVDNDRVPVRHTRLAERLGAVAD